MIRIASTAEITLPVKLIYIIVRFVFFFFFAKKRM